MPFGHFLVRLGQIQGQNRSRFYFSAGGESGADGPGPGQNRFPFPFFIFDIFRGGAGGAPRGRAQGGLTPTYGLNDYYMSGNMLVLELRPYVRTRRNPFLGTWE